jgi:hypothetical protein
MSQTIILNNDGTVSSNPVLTQQQCTNMGYIYKDNTCYWELLNTGSTINNCLYPDENHGVLFSYNENDNEECSLNISFDYLLAFDCDRMYDCMNNNCHTIENFNHIKLTAHLATTQSGIQTNKYSKPIIEVSDFVNYIKDNDETGIILSGNNCDIIFECITNELGDDCVNMNENTLNSDWKHFDMIINDTTILNEINGYNITIVVQNENCTCGLNLLLDNIKINKTCKQTLTQLESITVNPGFELEKIRDDKKSWLYSHNKEHRQDNHLEFRETDYIKEDERLILNTKEIDISLDSAHAIETDIFNYIKKDDCIVTTPITGTTTSISDLLGVNVNTLNTEYDLFKIINSKLINVTNRQTSTSYPTKGLLYEYYKNPALIGCSGHTNEYTITELNKFYNIYGSYWSDLIEQLVPSTAIWSGTYIYRNSIYHDMKFMYKNTGIIPCGPDTHRGSANVKCEFYTTASEDETGCLVKTDKPYKMCNIIYASGINLSNEFRGTIQNI